ncbi:A designed zinc finger protein bound To Dna, partial [Zopfochytrium polystomum]
YPCPTCPKSFRARANLRDHLRIHNRARNHPCPTCHKTFYRSQDLLRHQSTHMLPSERPHVCPNGCGRRFGRADAAYRH